MLCRALLDGERFADDHALLTQRAAAKANNPLTQAWLAEAEAGLKHFKFG
jgi:hypothetical protein